MADRPLGLREAPAPFEPDRPDNAMEQGGREGDDSPVWLWETDAQLRFTYVTEQFSRLTGIARDQVIGRTRIDLLRGSGIESARLQQHLADLEARRPFRDFCYRVTHPATGAPRHIRASGKPVFDRTGGFAGYRGTGTEITAEAAPARGAERAEARLRDELRTQYLRFDAALNNMIQGLCMFDAEQRLIVCNERYLQMYGFSGEVVKPGILLREIMEYSVALGNYRREDALRAIAERPCTASLREQTVLHQRLNDGRVIAVMHQPMAGGGSVATYEDVTQTVRAEQALRDYAARLERSNRELEAFASIASHDLQEPLRKIEAFGDRLAARCADELSETGRLYIDRMQDAAGRMRALINDLLTYSRVTTKAHPFVPVDLGRIAAEVMSDLQVTIEQADARIELGELPVVEADPTQMRQLLQNLLSNALKFRCLGRPPVVRISGRTCRPAGAKRKACAAGLCEITVADNGIGFKPRYAERIFGIFQRLHGRGEYPGTGIGLATCRKILERHGGSITASGRAGEGATFVFTLPVKRPGGLLP